MHPPGCVSPNTYIHLRNIKIPPQALCSMIPLYTSSSCMFDIDLLCVKYIELLNEMSP